MAVTSDLLAWLADAMDAAQRDAEAAANDCEATWSDGGQYGDAVLTVRYSEPVAVGPWSGSLPDGVRQHIARHDPAAVLRRIAADRKLIADLLDERHTVVDGDCWYTCAAATEEHDGGETCDDDRCGKPCDCGRDARVERRLRIIAEGYGWEETDG